MLSLSFMFFCSVSYSHVMDYRLALLLSVFGKSDNLIYDIQKTYVLIQEGKNWKNAQTYCRTHYTDLAMIENAEEQANMTSVKGINSAWIGMYREAWRWSDNRDSSFRNWKVNKPDNNQSYCVMSDEKYQWEDLHCKDKLPFWCQEASLGSV
uniref:C-type lectin domain-containing protein n=1 Tax=Labrus bergylta TaxID=56723 RepID=A0A3Q3EVU9_9LABR